MVSFLPLPTVAFRKILSYVRCWLVMHNLVDAAKNIILAGVKSVTLHDVGNVEGWDLSSNFYFSEKDIGKNRALACVDKLKELNAAVAVLTHTEELTENLLAAHQVFLWLYNLWPLCESSLFISCMGCYQ